MLAGGHKALPLVFCAADRRASAGNLSGAGTRHDTPAARLGEPVLCDLERGSA